MTNAYADQLEEIVNLTRQIDSLAARNDWVSMHHLVEKRMLSLNHIFDDLKDSETRQLGEAECEQLAEIVDSNERILRNARARQDEIIAFAGTHRAGAAAQQAYATHTR